MGWFQDIQVAELPPASSRPTRVGAVEARARRSSHKTPARRAVVDLREALPPSPCPRETALLWAVLELAVIEAIEGAAAYGSKTSERDRVTRDARAFLSDHRGETYCDLLGLDIDWVRRRVARARAEMSA